MAKVHNTRVIAAVLGAAVLFQPLRGVCAAAATAPRAVVPLSLKRAVSLAFRNNKDIRVQEKEIDYAKAGIAQARSEFLPKFDAIPGYTHNDAVLTFPGAPGVSYKKDLGLFMGYKNQLQLNLLANEKLYDGGASIANYNQAKLSFKVQEETLRARRLEVEFETKRLYYGLLLAFDVMRINRDLVVQARLHYKDVRNKFQQGTSSRFELLQAKVHLSKQMPGYIRARNDIDLIMADLKKLLGLKLNDTIKPEGRLTYSPTPIDEDEFLKAAYANNPGMILKLLGIDVNRWSIELAKSGMRPHVDVNGGVLYRSNDVGDMFANKHENWNVGVTVRIPIFDGFSTRAKVEQAKARYSEASLEKEDYADQLAVDIRKACLDMVKAEAIVNSQRDNVKEAKEALRISQVSFDNGVGTNLDVFDAQTSLCQIEKDLSDGIYDYLMARAFLDKTMGIESLVAAAKSEALNEKCH